MPICQYFSDQFRIIAINIIQFYLWTVYSETDLQWMIKEYITIINFTCHSYWEIPFGHNAELKTCFVQMLDHSNTSLNFVNFDIFI